MPVIRAAGFPSPEAAQEGAAVVRKGNKTNVFAGSNLGARLTSAGIEFLVVLGQYGGCCVAHSILGTPKHPPRPKERSQEGGDKRIFVVPTKPLPKPPSANSGKRLTQPSISTSSALRTPDKPLPVLPSDAQTRPTARPTLRQYDEIRRKPLPPTPKDKDVRAVQKLDAVSYCIVLTSPSLVNGDLPGSVKNHPKCFVFEAVGAEMWPKAFCQRMADRSRNTAV